MGDPLTALFAQWAQRGGAVLLNQMPRHVICTSAEELIAEGTARCRDSSRLTWVVLDWMIRHADQLDARQLIALTETRGDLSVLGVLCDAARERRTHPLFDRVIAECPPAPSEEIFFHRVARSPLASRLTREDPHPLFQRWNYLSNELSYL